MPNSVLCIYRHFVGRQNVMWLAPLPPKRYNEVILEIVWRHPFTGSLPSAMGTIFGLSFHFCFWGFMHGIDHTHSLASFQLSGLFNQRMPYLTEKCLYKGRRAVSLPICASNVRNDLASADQGFSTASQDSRNAHSMS